MLDRLVSAPQVVDETDEGCPSPAPQPSGSAPAHEPSLALLAVAAAALLSACGGEADGNVRDGVPVGMLHAETATAKPELLGHEGFITTEGRMRALAAARAPTPTELMDWAERQFPMLFPSHQSNRVHDGTLFYRHYPQSDNYLGVQNGTVLVLGPVSEGRLLSVGTLADFAPQVFAGLLAGSVTEAEAARFLMHAQAFATDESIAAVRRLGWGAWLDEQIAQAPSQSGGDWLVSRGYSAIDETHTSFRIPTVSS